MDAKTADELLERLRHLVVDYKIVLRENEGMHQKIAELKPKAEKMDQIEKLFAAMGLQILRK